MYSHEFNWRVSTDLDNGLSSKRRHTIAWTNNGGHRRFVALLHKGQCALK